MIKKYFFLLFFFFLTIGHAQSPEKFTYQSIIKNSAGYLLKSQDVGLKISVLFNSSNGIAVYSEEHTVESNNNGLVTLIIVEGVSSDVFSDIDWGGGEFFLKVEVDPEGGVNYVMEQTSQLLSVPYALYAGNANVNLSVTGQDYITISGNQINASKIDATTDIVGLSDVSTSGDYDDLINTPTLFDGDYANLTNTPQLNDGKIFVGDSSNKSSEVAVSGDVTITNAGVTAIGAEKVVNTMLVDDAVTTVKITDANVTTAKLADDAVTTVKIADANVTTAKLADDAVTTVKIIDANVTTAKLADDAVTTAKLANIAQGSILVGGASDAPTVYDAKTEGQILVGDGTDIASVAVSGDVTLAKTGAVTIADDAVTTVKITDANVTTAKIADDAVTTAKLANITQGSILVGGASDAPTVYDAKTEGQILVGDGTDIASVAVSGDVTLAKTGAVTIADDAVNLTTKVAGVLPIANGGTGGNTNLSARTSLGIISGSVVCDGSTATIITNNVGVDATYVVTATFSLNAGVRNILSANANSNGTITIVTSANPNNNDKISFIAIDSD